MPDPDLLIVGGTARAPAWAAIRAGLRVAALDRFNDLDLLACADPVFLWDGGEAQVERVVGDLGVPWIYCGPLENEPDLIDRCAARAPLRGNPGDALRAVRDPVRLQAALSGAGLPTLAVRDETDPPPPDGRWLIKPRSSCGGHWVAVWDAGNVEYPTRWGPHYFQELLRAGPRLLTEAIPFDAGDGAGSAMRLLGTFRGGGPFDGDFIYRETWGPHPPRGGPPNADVDWANAVVRAFGLRGLGGVDLAVGWRNGRFRAAVEVNPRFTSSMELCATPAGPFGSADARTAPPATFRAKRIVYADRPVHVGRLPVFGPHDADAWIADVPAPGSAIAARVPICTVFAEEPRGGDDRAAAARVRAQLDRREARVRAELSPA